MCEAVKQAFAEERLEVQKKIALKLLKKENGNYASVAETIEVSVDQIKKWEQEQ